MDAGKPPLGLAWSMSRIGAEVSNRFARRVGPLGLTPPQAATLHSIARGEASQRELALRMGLVPSRMVALLDGLESQGLVRRAVDPDDRRRHVVTLTDQGQDVLRQLGALAREHEEDIVGGLSGDELAELRRLLTAVEERLGLHTEGHPGMGSTG